MTSNHHLLLYAAYCRCRRYSRMIHAHDKCSSHTCTGLSMKSAIVLHAHRAASLSLSLGWYKQALVDVSHQFGPTQAVVLPRLTKVCGRNNRLRYANTYIGVWIREHESYLY